MSLKVMSCGKIKLLHFLQQFEMRVGDRSKGILRINR